MPHRGIFYPVGNGDTGHIDRRHISRLSLTDVVEYDNFSQQGMNVTNHLAELLDQPWRQAFGRCLD